jgi:hypothetical protein
MLNKEELNIFILVRYMLFASSYIYLSYLLHLISLFMKS